MQVFKIHSMAWANAEQTSVMLVADTNTGPSETIFTPYSDESIIWNAVQEFPVDQIAPYVPPAEQGA